MGDTLRETLEAVVDQAESNPDQPLQPVEPKSDAPSEPTEKVSATSTPETRSESVQEPSHAPELPKKDLQAEQLAAAQGKKAAPPPPEQKVDHVTERAPTSWTQEAKGEWAKLPLGVRQEVLKREKEITEALGQSADARNLMTTMDQMVAPYIPRMRANNVHPLQAIRNLLEVDNLLATAPQAQRASFLAKAIKDYGIDINELDSALAGQIKGIANPSAGINEAVQAAIQPLLQPIQDWQRAQAAETIRTQNEAIAKVQKMELDPQYEFFQEVRDYMADIVEMQAKRGLAITPEEAYTLAIQTHPEISKIVAERRDQDAARTALTRGTEAAQRLRGAAVSVGSSVPVGTQAQPNGAMSLRDTIEAAFTAVGSGGRI